MSFRRSFLPPIKKPVYEAHGQAHIGEGQMGNQGGYTLDRLLDSPLSRPPTSQISWHLASAPGFSLGIKRHIKASKELALVESEYRRKLVAEHTQNLALLPLQ